ncbi:MAG: curli production assembly/transport component CsgG [Paludibacter sp.]|nr:curli production assembly/transport component CsgG [Paludibacter sp.]
MIKKTSLLRVLYVLICMVLFTYCSPYMHQPMKSRRAILGPESPAKQLLMELPKPQDKIVTAVYKFRDQTGQYKASETGANWSTAVTQGATTILIRALEESGWFIPIERENMANLLNERKIIRSSRAQYEGADQNSESLLPPLLFAGVLLEGGIISYESNMVTGGAGIRYFGASLSGQYREDRVSVYIRAVSTANGKVLKTVYTTKSILSQEVSAGFFRYVKSKRLLEAETGFTYNEPSEICITEAIEKAVESLIIEGVKNKLWNLQNASDTTSIAFKNYEDEKRMNYESDAMGKKIYENNRGAVMLGANVGSNSYSGDFSKTEVRPNYSFNIGVALHPNFYLDSEIGYRGLMVWNKVDDYSYFGDLSLRYIFLPYDRFTPFLNVGGGYDYQNEGVGLSKKQFLPKINGAFGLEYMIRNKLGVTLSSGVNYYLRDSFDGSIAGKYNDLSWNISLGLKLYMIDLKHKK